MPKFYVSFDLGMEIYADNEDEAREFFISEIDSRIYGFSEDNIDVEKLEEVDDNEEE